MEALDQGLLAELLGRAELRELLDPEVLAEVEAMLKRTDPERRARDAEGVADLLRWLGVQPDPAAIRPPVDHSPVMAAASVLLRAAGIEPNAAIDDRLPSQIRAQVEVRAKYAGYIERQEEEIVSQS